MRHLLLCLLPAATSFFAPRAPHARGSRFTTLSTPPTFSTLSTLRAFKDQLDAIVEGGGTASVVPGEGGVFRWQQVETDFCLLPQDSF